MARTDRQRRRNLSPIKLDPDENGVYVTVDTAELRYVVLEMDGGTMRGLMSMSDAWEFYEHVQDALAEWYAEGCEQRDNVRAHRDHAGVPLADSDGYAVTDPKHPGFLESADLMRDMERGK